MQRRAPLLINTEAIELWPSHLLRACSTLDARLLSQAQWVLRRKRDGRFLAAVTTHGVHSLVPRLPREPGVEEALALLDAAAARPQRHQHRAMRERIQRCQVQVLLRQRVGYAVRCVGRQADRGSGQQRTHAGQQGRLTRATFKVEHEGSLRSTPHRVRNKKKRAAVSGAFSCPTLHGTAEAYLTAQ